MLHSLHEIIVTKEKNWLLLLSPEEIDLWNTADGQREKSTNIIIIRLNFKQISAVLISD
jgi:hypothetical protein